MANVELSERVKKLAKDFVIEQGKLAMPPEKVKAWAAELESVPADERQQCGEELIAVALRFEAEGGEDAALGTAQLYVLAAGVLGGVAAVKKAVAAGGWGPKKTP